MLSPRPLTRLNVTDSLRINADRWSLEHRYHRLRQNIHYQSLYTPGIVQGLGISIVREVEDVQLQFEETTRYCWIEIQPGLAIDIEGNPIVVGCQEPRRNRLYPISIPNPVEKPHTLYVVVSYVDPDGLEFPPEQDCVLERFRFDQRVNDGIHDRATSGTVLEPTDIELCRVSISAGRVEISSPADPMDPQINQLDFRYRPTVQLCAQHTLRVGIYNAKGSAEENAKGVFALAKATAHLCPSLQVEIEEIPLEISQQPPGALPDLIFCDASVLSQPQTRQQAETIERLSAFLAEEGCLMILPDQEAIQRLGEQIEIIENVLTDNEMKENLNRLHRQLPPSVSLDHLLRREPFLFSSFPRPLGKSIELFYERGLFVAMGPMARLWSGYYLKRSQIREMHEWGINLLYYAAHYQQYARLSRSPSEV